MKNYLSVKSGPQEFICGVGAWQELETELSKRQLKKILVLHGQASWEVAQKHFPAVENCQFIYYHYRQKCTDENIAYFEGIATAQEVDGVMAVGGGKVSDLAKGVAFKLRLPVIMLPTLASTCAAYTPLSVIYDEQGSLKRMDYYNRGIALTLVDPEVILDSPKELLVAGIGDTLAKWYEADAIISHRRNLPLEVEVSHFAAKKCQHVLLAKGPEALEALENQKLNKAFVDVVETIIMIAGMVGGFGDEYGRSSGAHSIHDALTHIPESGKQLHGKKVAYGILVQLLIQDKWEELESLIPFYEELGLPTSLHELGLDLTIEEVELVSEKAAAPGEPIHFMKEEITPEVVSEAIYGLEKFRN